MGGAYTDLREVRTDLLLLCFWPGVQKLMVAANNMEDLQEHVRDILELPDKIEAEVSPSDIIVSQVETFMEVLGIISALSFKDTDPQSQLRSSAEFSVE